LARTDASPLGFALACALACLGAALVAVSLGPVGTRAGLWGFTIGHGLFSLALALALAAFALGVWTAWRGGRRVAGLVVALLALAVAAAPARDRQIAWQSPPIHDVSTDLDNPPRYVAVVTLRGADANPVAHAGDPVADQQRASYGDLRPLILTVPPRRVLALAADTARAEGWTVVAEDIGFGDFGRLEATDATFWFGRVDDIVVRVMPHEAGSRVDVRSSARDDAVDGGRNARRIRRFLAYLAERARAEPAGPAG
jgi:hypothetical protein